MSKSGTYNIIRVGKKTMSEHKHVWEKTNGKIPDGLTIHHINNNPRDNRIENLRLLTRQENRALAWHGSIEKKGKKYRVRRTINGIRTWLGSFDTPGGAYMASRMAYVTR